MKQMGIKIVIYLNQSGNLDGFSDITGPMERFQRKLLVEQHERKALIGTNTNHDINSNYRSTNVDIGNIETIKKEDSSNSI